MGLTRRLTELFHIDLPILLAPMAGAMDATLAIEVAKAGGLGSLPAAMLTADQLRAQVAAFRAAVDAPINLNFFAHTSPVPNNAREHAWREALKPYYGEYGIDPNAPVPTSNRAPFDDAFCAVVEEVKPAVVSFHFGLPEPSLVARVKAAGCAVIASATTAAEARWLEERGCDAIIAQGYEAGGHRGVFLSDDLATQVGTFALVPQVADAVKVPVIAAGGITDARGIVAAVALGADGVQIGTAYLASPESKILPPHRALLKARTEETAVTNVMTGRPARGFVNRVMRELGPISDLPPAFPLAGGALAPLHAKAQAQGSGDFSSMWAGQAAALVREMPAAELTRTLWADAQDLMARMAAR
ncbi:nitronate monooxygenase family protein [Microbacteriaceae bacterium K1510]|nr:nitronate monooxygenase family protein [Microbacteriaceae bacterium K1510]